MSSKNRSGKNIEGDKFYTPPWCVRQCVEIVLPTIRDNRPPKRIIEPSAGAGAFLEQLRPALPSAHIVANDLDPTVGPWDDANVSMHADFLADPMQCDFDLCIGNPPFTLALEFVEKSLMIATQVVYLLRQGFLASEERREILRKSPLSDIFALAHRPSFTADGKTDSENYLFCCWTDGWWDAPARFHLLPTVSLDERKVLAKGLKGYEPKAVVPRLHHDKLFGSNSLYDGLFKECPGCGYPFEKCGCPHP